ncbi:MAG TPA: hypothetical protein VHX65_10605 [Pirellulales bacterium]|nr:hypothetical protein [Pirellulales bacterium]
MLAGTYHRLLAVVVGFFRTDETRGVRVPAGMPSPDNGWNLGTHLIARL